MYTIPETFSVRAEGRLIVCQAGSRGVVTHQGTGDTMDLDAGLERALGPKKLKELLTAGKIVEA